MTVQYTIHMKYTIDTGDAITRASFGKTDVIVATEEAKMQRRARQGAFWVCVVSQLAFGGSALDIQDTDK